MREIKFRVWSKPDKRMITAIKSIDYNVTSISYWNATGGTNYIQFGDCEVM